MATTSHRKGNRTERKEIPSMKFRRNYSGNNLKEVPFFKKYPEIANITVYVKQAHPDLFGKFELRYDKFDFEDSIRNALYVLISHARVAKYR